MTDSRWRPAAVLLLVSAAAACPGIAGCSRVTAHDPAAAAPSLSAASPAGTTPAGASSAGTASARTASGGPFSAATLRAALLTRVNGVSTVASAASGDYASLPEGSAGPGGSAGRPSANAVRVIPAACGSATMTGFNPAVLAGSPAAAATFRVGRNGVSEMLVASSVKVALRALAGRLPAACTHYRETVDGKSFRYTARESAVSGIGRQALVLNVRSAGGAVDNLWSLIYRGAGFVGSVTVVGPSASGAAARELGEQAYRFAARSLS